MNKVRYCCDGDCCRGRQCPAIDRGVIDADSAPTARETWGFWIVACIGTVILVVGAVSLLVWAMK